MDKRTILTGFNDHFREFIDDVLVLFPNNKDVRAAHTALIGIRKANPILICKVWKSAIVDIYQIEIEAGNLDYFISKEYGTDFSPDLQWIVKKLDHFRKPLKNISDTNKEKVLKYLQNLGKLCNLYFSNSDI